MKKTAEKKPGKKEAFPCGALVGALSHEVEEQKNTLKVLCDNEEKFRLLFELSPQAIAVTDFETGNIIEVNSRLCELYGCTREQLIGKTSVELKVLDNQTREKLKNELKAKKEVLGIEICFRKPNNDLVYCLLNSSVIQVQGATRIITVFSDITRFKKNQTDFKKYLTAIEASASTIVITNQQAQIEYANPFFTQITGYTVEEAIGQNPKILKSGLHPKSFYKDLWSTILQGKIWKGEFYNRKKNGEYYWESASISPIHNEAGEITNFVAVKEDITEKKMYLESLKQSEQQLRESNATKDKFFSIIGHDLMDPFNALLGFSNILIESLQNNEKEDAVQYASYIQQSANKVFNLLQNLLIWSKAQRGQMAHQPMIVNVHELIADSLAGIQHIAQTKEIDIELEIEENLRAFIDYNMISTVIRNLASNAVKFTEKGGSVTLSAKIIDHELVCSIKDSGIGMNEQQVNNLFRIDKNVSTKGTSDEVGTGLGLIICKEFVDIHNGRIWVESHETKGSKFSFSIPNALVSSQ